MPGKAARQQRILELVRRNEIASQDQLLDLLDVEGIECSQTTLSRDLRELGIVKDAEAYRVASEEGVGPDGLRRLARGLAPQLRAADAGGSVTVLRSQPGRGAQVAATVDGAGVPQIVAAVATGDVVLVVARSPADARRLASVFARHLS